MIILVREAFLKLTPRNSTTVNSINITGSSIYYTDGQALHICDYYFGDMYIGILKPRDFFTNDDARPFLICPFRKELIKFLNEERIELEVPQYVSDLLNNTKGRKSNFSYSEKN